MSISVAEAASRLGRSPQQVRNLIHSRSLMAQQIGRTWLVDERSVARLAGWHLRPGRPMAPTRAWALLDLLAEGKAEWLTSAARSQVRSLIRAEKNPDANRWRTLLQGAAERRPTYCHPAALAPLVAEEHLIEAGPRVASRHGIDLLSQQGPHEVFISAGRWPELEHRYGLQEARSVEQVSLVTWIPRWDSAMELMHENPNTRRLAVALTLIYSADPRAVKAGHGALIAARRRLVEDAR